VDWTLKTQATNSQVSNLVGMSNAAPTNTADALSLNGGLPLKDKIELDGESLSFDLLKAFNEKRKSDLDQEKQKSLDELKAAEAKKKQEEQAASEVNFVVGKLHYQVDGKDAEKIYSLPVTFTNRENGATGSASFVIKASDLGSGQVVLKNIALQNGNIWVDLKVTLPEKNASTVTSGTNSVKSLGLTAKHEVSPPRTALLEYKGIVLEREKNKVNDVLEGVSLDLKKAKNDAISFRIEWNDENILNHLINYVGQYNIIMEMINQFLSSDKPGMEVKEEIKPRYGLFRGELALQMLKSKLRQIAIDMHPTSQSETLSLLSQMGISPPYSGGNPNDVNIGKLEMKEDVTKKMIHEHPELVAELFAYDKDGDKIPEVGVAIDTTKLTKNYITRGAVLDVEKDTAKKRIEQLDKEIKVAEASLETYRKKMVSEFTTLEAAQKEFEKVRKYFDAVGGGKE
jgi:flagellar capping protein FliD